MTRKRRYAQDYQPPTGKFTQDVEDAAVIYNLNRAFRASGKTQLEVSRNTGIPISSLNDYLQGKMFPRLNVAARLAREFGVSLDVLANGSPDSNSGAKIGIDDCAQAVGVSYRAMSRLADMSALAKDPRASGMSGFNTADLLLSSPDCDTVFKNLECALVIAAGEMAQSSDDTYQTFRYMLKTICRYASRVSVGDDKLDENAFDMALDKVIGTEEMDKIAFQYNMARGQYLLSDEASIDHYIQQAANALQSIFHDIADQIKYEVEQEALNDD